MCRQYGIILSRTILNLAISWMTEIGIEPQIMVRAIDVDQRNKLIYETESSQNELT